MKSPDSPHSERRSTPPPLSFSKEPGPVRSEERERRSDEYSLGAAPWDRQGSNGTRNLVLGTLILLGAIALLGQAVFLAGPDAAIPMGAALLAVVTLFIVSRTRLLRQRNGGFLALGLVCLIAAVLPLVQYAWKRAATPEPVPSSGSALTRSDDALATDTPRLTLSFSVPAVTDGAESFKVLRDFHVEMADGKVYLIKAGEVLPLAEKADGEVRFLAENQKIGLPEKMVEMIPAAKTATDAQTPLEPGSLATPAMASTADASTPPAAEEQPETPAKITERSQKEAIRRYPALGQKDSPENQLFIETFQELKHSGADDFFADPEWPMHLAELLAKRNWQRE